MKMEEPFCTTSTDLNAMEGKRHREVKVTYDYNRRKASYLERDLLKNSVVRTAETELPGCVADILTGLNKLRTLKLEPGQSTQAVLSDGKKVVSARVEAQEREEVKTKMGTFNTIRYEPFVFNGVLFARKAELQVWITDDARALAGPNSRADEFPGRLHHVPAGEGPSILENRGRRAVSPEALTTVAERK